MTFKKLARKEASGTSYQGIITMKYPELCAIFGQPEGPSGDAKTQAQWTIEIAGGVVATIYDYKEEQEARDIMQWHIGGRTKDVVQLVKILIKEHRKNNK